MNNTKHAVFITIYLILVKSKKHYVTPSIDAIIELIAKRHATNVHRRWVFQCVHDLIEMGYLKRQRRYLQRENGEILQIPSLLSVTLKGARKLYNMGVRGAELLTKAILSWIHTGDKRFPQEPYSVTRAPAGSIAGSFSSIGDLVKLPGL